MKEKRVDIYLAKAGLYQLMTIGFGGACLNEFVKVEINGSIALLSGLSSIGAFAYMMNIYSKAKKIIKKPKK